MIESINVPGALSGNWHHAIILTYGANIQYFENLLLQDLAKARCRNIVILADEQRLLENAAFLAKYQLTRYINHRYIVSGIHVQHAAHAKMILLTHPQKGRLLVGSGNLSADGYASGGEIFIQYEYSNDHPDTLNAFHTVRQMLTALAEREYLGGIAREHIIYMLDDTPWLFQTAPNKWHPVRHNLDHSFLNQLVAEIEDDSVEELWIHAPFHDTNAVALERLITDLAPRRTILLIQKGRTSADIDAINRVIESVSTSVEVRLVKRAEVDGDPYIHAKFYLAKMSGHSICMTGSANTSQVALLLSPPNGNLELVNMLRGERDEFDHLLNSMEIGEAIADLEELEIQIGEDDREEFNLPDDWHLTGGEWSGTVLTLQYRGTLPSEIQVGCQCTLLVGNVQITGSISYRGPTQIRLGEFGDINSLFDDARPVRLLLSTQSDSEGSNPIFPCHRQKLNQLLEISDEIQVVGRLGGLEIDDSEIETLFQQLSESLVLDEDTILYLSRRSHVDRVNSTDKGNSTDGEPGTILQYEQINFEEIRRHPRMQQYLVPRGGSTGFLRSGSTLQAILASMHKFYNRLRDRAFGISISDPLASPDSDIDDEQDFVDEDEAEEAEKEKQRAIQDLGKRNRRIVKRFIQRFLQEIQKPIVQKLLGTYGVMHTVIVMEHILWRLFFRDWIEDEFILDSYLDLWQFMWGNEGAPSSFMAGLNSEERSEVLIWIRESHADAQMLASLYYGATVIRKSANEELGVRLRDFARHILNSLPFDSTVDCLEDVWLYVADTDQHSPPLPSEIVERFSQLAEFNTERTFLRDLENRLGLPSHSCKFDHMVKVYRHHHGNARVTTLFVNSPTTPFTLEFSLRALRTWIRYEKRGYYRIALSIPGRDDPMIFFDSDNAVCAFRGIDGEAVEISVHDLYGEYTTPWTPSLDTLADHALAVEDELTMPTIMMVAARSS